MTIKQFILSRIEPEAKKFFVQNRCWNRVKEYLLEEIDKYGCAQILRRATTNPLIDVGSVLECFNWSRTKEGLGYWLNLRYKYYGWDN